MAVPSSRKLYNILRSGDIHNLKKYMADGGDINIQRTADQMHVLAISLVESNSPALFLEMCKWYIDNGKVHTLFYTLVEETSKRNSSSILEMALIKGGPDVINYLIENEPYPSFMIHQTIRFTVSQGDEGKKIPISFLEMALLEGDDRTVSAILDKVDRDGFDLNYTTQTTKTPVAWYASTKKCYDLMVEHGFDESKFDYPFPRSFFLLHKYFEMSTTRQRRYFGVSVEDMLRESIAIDESRGINAEDFFAQRDNSGKTIFDSLKAMRNYSSGNSKFADYTSEYDLRKSERKAKFYEAVKNLGVTPEFLEREGVKSPVVEMMDMLAKGSNTKETVVIFSTIKSYIRDGFSLKGVDEKSLNNSIFTIISNFKGLQEEGIYSKGDLFEILQMCVDAGARITPDIKEGYPEKVDIYMAALQAEDIDIINFVFDNTKTPVDKIINPDDASDNRISFGDNLITEAIYLKSPEVVSYVIDLYKSVGINPINKKVFDYMLKTSVFNKEVYGEVMTSVDSEEAKSLVSPMLTEKEYLEKHHPSALSEEDKDEKRIMDSAIIKVIKHYYMDHAGKKEVNEHVGKKEVNEHVRDIVRSLLDSTSVYHTDNESTLASYAAIYHVDILKDVVGKYGTDCLFIRGKDGMLPLHRAILSNNIKSVKYILSLASKDDLEFYNNEELPLYVARSGLGFEKPNHTLTMFEELSQKGIALNVTSKNGDTPIHYFCKTVEKTRSDEATRIEYHDFCFVLNFLIESGCDINAENNNGERANTIISIMSKTGLKYHAELAKAGADYKSLSSDGEHPLSEIINGVLRDYNKYNSEGGKYHFNSFIDNFVKSTEGLPNVGLSVIRGSGKYVDGLTLADAAIFAGNIDAYEKLSAMGIEVTTKPVSSLHAKVIKDMFKAWGNASNYNNELMPSDAKKFFASKILLESGYIPTKEDAHYIMDAACKIVSDSKHNDGKRDNGRKLTMEDLRQVADRILEIYPESATKIDFYNAGLPYLYDAIGASNKVMFDKLVSMGADVHSECLIRTREQRPIGNMLSIAIQQEAGRNDSDDGRYILQSMLEQGCDLKRACLSIGNSVEDVMSKLNDESKLMYLAWKTEGTQGNRPQVQAPRPRF